MSSSFPPRRSMFEPWCQARLLFPFCSLVAFCDQVILTSGVPGGELAAPVRGRRQKRQEGDLEVGFPTSMDISKRSCSRHRIPSSVQQARVYVQARHTLFDQYP